MLLKATHFCRVFKIPGQLKKLNFSSHHPIYYLIKLLGQVVLCKNELIQLGF